MLFYINTARSRTGEKIRLLTGMPLISCEDEQKGDVIDSSADGNEEEPCIGSCTDDLCRMSFLSKLNDTAEREDGKDEEEENKVKPKSDHPKSISHMPAIDDENAAINMHMLIMDVPNGGEYYRYPCSSELSTIPRTFSPLIVKDSPDVRSLRLSGKKGKGLNKEGEEILESAFEETKSSSTGRLREYCNRTIASSIGYPSSLRTPPSGSASTITTEASLKENQYAQQPVFTLSNIDQITRQFISDYQGGKLIK